MREGWEIKNLGKICDLLSGYAFKSKWYVDYSNTMSIRMSNIRPNGNFDPDHNSRFLPDELSEEYERYLLSEGDLVIAMTDMASDPKILGLPTIIKNLNGRNFLLNQRVGKLHKFSDEIYVPFLRYYLSSPKIKEYYKSKGAGGLQINIGKKDVLSAKIPIPPLFEQKRIVEILDEAFEAIDQAKSNVERNIENAEELFQSKLKQTFDELYDSYESSTIGKKFNTSAGGTPKKSNKDYYDNGNIPWLRSGEVKQGDIFETEMFITEKGLSESSAKLFPKNTVLVAMYGATAGDVGILRLEASTNQAVCGIFPNDDFTSEFIYYLIHYKREMLVNQAIGNAQPNLSQTKIKKLEIPSVPITVQKNVVSEIGQLSDSVDELVLGYNKQIESLEELKRSILQKAFSGELIANEHVAP